jgi:hypothetical protein
LGQHIATYFLIFWPQYVFPTCSCSGSLSTSPSHDALFADETTILFPFAVEGALCIAEGAVLGALTGLTALVLQVEEVVKPTSRANWKSPSVTVAEMGRVFWLVKLMVVHLEKNAGGIFS